MNYQKIYDDICKRGQERILPKEVYTEKHHIVPKCMEGTNEKSNLTVLTAREHFLVHYILTRIYPNNSKIWNALSKMLYYKSNGQQRYIPNSKFYEQIKIEISNASKGEGNPFYGKRHTDETKHIISIKRKGKYAGIHSPNFGKEMTEETKLKLSIANTGKCRSDQVKSEISIRTTGELNPFYGKRHTDETKKIIREKRKNQVFTDETRQKQRISNSGTGNPFYGKTHTDEAIEKMRNNKPHLRQCNINGIIYISIAEVARKLNMYVNQVRYRLLSTNEKWKDWIFINKTEEK